MTDSAKQKGSEHINFEHSVFIDEKDPNNPELQKQDNLNLQVGEVQYQENQGEIVETFGPQGTKLHKGVTLPQLPVVEPLCSFCNYKCYIPYYLITTNEVIYRLKRAFIPIHGGVLKYIRARPDIYGPFWIYTTLILMMAISGNIYRYSLVKNDSLMQFSYDYIPAAIGIVYLMGLFVPSIFFTSSSVFRMDLSYSDVIFFFSFNSGSVFMDMLALVSFQPSSFVSFLRMYIYTNFRSSNGFYLLMLLLILLCFSLSIFGSLIRY